MADYYPALARAISSLPNNNTHARQELYERARTILVEQLLRQSPQKSALRIKRERAVLETAIREVERTFLSFPTHMPSVATPPRLTVVIEHDSDDIGLRRESMAQDRVIAWPAPVQPETAETSCNPAMTAAPDMREIPTLLGAMFVRTAFIAGMLPLVGLIYIHGLILVSENVIRYPVLLVAIAAMLGLFFILPLAMFRKAHIATGIGFLLGLSSSKLRRGF